MKLPHNWNAVNYSGCELPKVYGFPYFYRHYFPTVLFAVQKPSMALLPKN